MRVLCRQACPKREQVRHKDATDLMGFGLEEQFCHLLALIYEHTGGLFGFGQRNCFRQRFQCTWKFFLRLKSQGLENIRVQSPFPAVLRLLPTEADARINSAQHLDCLEQETASRE